MGFSTTLPYPTFLPTVTSRVWPTCSRLARELDLTTQVAVGLVVLSVGVIVLVLFVIGVVEGVHTVLSWFL